MPGGWADSDRTSRLPAGWKQVAAAVKARDGHRCTWLERGVRCAGPADEVDHVIAGDDHSERNLRSLCTDHHRRKSSAEGNAARWRVSNRRPRERHPGLR
jgi:5-methylcytosine-specific restriction enzyme A